MIQENINRIKNELPSGVNLVAVSKFHPTSFITEAYEGGQRDFAESRPQELYAKVQELPKDIRWHFIGHLQSNKLKMVLPYAYLVQSVDSAKLLGEIQKYAAKESLNVNILLEVFISKDETKQGFSIEEANALAADFNYPNVTLCGLMGMASLTDDMEQVREEFRSLKTLFEKIQAEHKDTLPEFNILSMGMSGDYPIAVEEGATLVRIGTTIFGERQY